MVAKGVESVEAMKVGGPEKYEQLKQIYTDNAAIFGEQVDQIQSQIDMYTQMQAQGGEDMMPADGTSDMTATGTMPEGTMIEAGDEAMSQ